MNNGIRSLCLGLPLFAVGLLSGNIARGDGRPIELSDVPGSWARYHWNEIVELRTYLIAAYDIEDSDQAAFTHLYYEAWRAYYDHHVAFAQSVDINDSPEEAGRKLTEFSSNSPVDHLRLFRLVESILPPGNYLECRHRFEELVERGSRVRYRPTDNQIEGDEFIRKTQRVRSQSMSPVGKEGRPMPMAAYRRQSESPVRALQVGEIIKSPETCVTTEAGRLIGQGVFERYQPRPKPTVVGVNALPKSVTMAVPDSIALSQSAGSPSSNSWDGEPLVALAEDTWLGIANSMAKDCLSTVASSDVKRGSIHQTIDAIRRRVDVVRSQRAKDYLALEKVTSKEAFREALSRLDRNLEGLNAELACRIRVLCPGSVK